MTISFWYALFFSFVFMVALWLGILYGQIGRPTPSWVHHAYQLKQHLATAVHEPKIVIVSGSNALFGMDSRQLSQTYRRPVINYGVNAALLLPYILYRSKQVLKRGDIVLLPLEYPLYLYNGETNQQLIDHVWAYDPKFFWELTWQERFRLLWETPSERIWRGYQHYTNTQAPTNVLYGNHNIDAMTGDQLNHSKAKLVGQELLEWQAHTKMPAHQYAKNDRHDNLAWYYLREYIQWAQQEGVCLIFLPSAFHWRSEYRDNPLERNFYVSLAERIRNLGATYIGSPFDYMYTDEYLFNTEYHLTEEGKQLHTHKITTDLNAILLEKACYQQKSNN